MTTPPRDDPDDLNPADDEPTPTEQLLGRIHQVTDRSRSARTRGPIAVAVVAAIAVGGLGFAGGRLTAPAQTNTGTVGGGVQPPAGFGGPGNGGGFGGARPGGGNFGGFGGGLGPSIEGTITAVDSETLTLQMSDGQSLTINLADGTTVSRQESAERAELADGATVRVQVDPQGLASGGTELDASSITIIE